MAKGTQNRNEILISYARELGALYDRLLWVDGEVGKNQIVTGVGEPLRQAFTAAWALAGDMLTQDLSADDFEWIDHLDVAKSRPNPPVILKGGAQ